MHLDHPEHGASLQFRPSATLLVYTGKLSTNKITQSANVTQLTLHTVCFDCKVIHLDFSVPGPRLLTVFGLTELNQRLFISGSVKEILHRLGRKRGVEGGKRGAGEGEIIQITASMNHMARELMLARVNVS